MQNFLGQGPTYMLLKKSNLSYQYKITPKNIIRQLSEIGDIL